MKSQKGAALVIVLITMTILTIIGTAFLSVSMNAATSISTQNKGKQAYYLARSGADTVSKHLFQNPDFDLNFTIGATAVSSSNNSLPVDKGSFQVTITRHTGNTIDITGIGTVDGVTRQTTAKMGRATLTDIIDGAIYSTANLDITGMNVTGAVQSAGTINYSNNGSNQYTGTPKPNSPKYITMDWINPTGLTAYPDQDLVVNTTVTPISYSTKLNSIDIGNKGKLVINAGASELNVLVDTISIRGELEIIASGEGKVNLFVSTLMDIQTGGLINNLESKRLFIYMKDNSTFKHQANMVLNGYVIGPNANLEIQSAQSVVNGAVIGKILTKNGSIGPNGIVNYVPLNVSDVDSDFIKAYKVLQWDE